MADLLNVLLHRLFPGLAFRCIEHEGKQDLEKSVARKLRAWRKPADRFVVMRDQDAADCHAVKARLKALCEQGGHADALVRVFCREVEAWYLGDVESLAGAFPGSAGKLRRELRKSQFRNPDRVVGPSKVLDAFIPEFNKRPGCESDGRKAHTGKPLPQLPSVSRGRRAFASAARRRRQPTLKRGPTCR